MAIPKFLMGMISKYSQSVPFDTSEREKSETGKEMYFVDNRRKFSASQSLDSPEIYSILGSNLENIAIFSIQKCEQMYFITKIIFLFQLSNDVFFFFIF